jgi:glycosyltransferase involved in cell wall biosynthesis
VGLAAKLDDYRRRAVYEWNQARHRAAARKRKAAFQSWLDALSATPPEVLVGANFAAYGGVRHHIQAIQRYSALNVQLAPPESVLRTVGPHHLSHDFRQRFLDFPATGIKVVHSHVFPWFIDWCREKQKQGMRWVHTYHLKYFPEHGPDGLEPWQAEINDALINVACHADVKLSVSKWQVEELRREHHIEAQYLPNGVDVALCDAADASRFRSKTGLEDFVLYVGRNDPVKNPRDFVLLAERLPNLQFVMVGGALSEESLRRDWQIEVPSNLRVLGSCTYAKVQDAIAACSVLVVTSKREGLPTLVMEGMAHRKPVVVPDELGCVEVIGQGQSELVYEPGNLDNLADKALLALNSSGANHIGRQRVLDLYDWRVIAPQLDAIYRNESR